MSTSTALPLKIIAFVVVAAIGLAGCGGDDDDSASNGSQDSSTTTTENGSAAPVSVDEIDGTEVLVNAQGSALYSAEEEAGGQVLCVGPCLAIWEPVAAADTGSVPADLGGEIGTVKRPGGGSQLTFDGSPLYRFTEEGPGQLTGDGLVDSFNGTEFTWQAASTGEEASGSGETTEETEPPSGGGGYGY